MFIRPEDEEMPKLDRRAGELTAVGVNFVDDLANQPLLSDDVFAIRGVNHVQQTFFDQQTDQLDAISFGQPEQKKKKKASKIVLSTSLVRRLTQLQTREIRA